MNDKFKSKYLQKKVELEDMLCGGGEHKKLLQGLRGKLEKDNEDNGGKLIIPSLGWDKPMCLLGYLEVELVQSIMRATHNLNHLTTALAYLTAYGSQINDAYYLDRKRVSLLHSVIVAPSGYTKTETLQHIYTPISEIDAKGYEQYEEDLKAWEMAQKNADKQKDKTTPDNQNVTVVMKQKPHPIDRIITANTTANGLKKYLSDKEKNKVNEGTFVYQPEMTSFFEGLGRFTGRKTQESGEMSGVLDGDITKDPYVKEKYIIRDPRFGMCGAIPPLTLLDIYSDSPKMVTQGIYSRFVYSTYYPDELIVPSFKLHRDRDDEGNKKDEYDFERRMLEKILKSRVDEMEVDNEAEILFKLYTQYITERQNYYGEGEGIIGNFKQSLTFHATKKIMSLAVFVHKLNEAVRIMNGVTSEWTHKISLKDLQFAINFISFFNNSFFDFLDKNGGNNCFAGRKETQMNSLIRKIIRRVQNEANDDESYELKESTVKNWFSACRGGDNDLADHILESMVENGWLRSGKGYNGTTIYFPTTSLLNHRDSRV